MDMIYNNYLSSSDSDEDNSAVRKKKFYKKRKLEFEPNFKELYRFEPYNFEYLVNTFLPDENYETRGGALSNTSKMKIFLRYISDPGYQVKLYFLKFFIYELL